MEKDRHIWRIWAGNLQQWGVDEWAAVILEAAGPLAVFAAQGLYLLQPLVGKLEPGGQIEAIARLLEDAQNTQDFVQYLREAPDL
jgi:hypothetical protein